MRCLIEKVRHFRFIFSKISHVSNTEVLNLNVTSNTDLKKVNARLKIPFSKFKNGGTLNLDLVEKSIVKSWYKNLCDLKKELLFGILQVYTY